MTMNFDRGFAASELERESDRAETAWQLRLNDRAFGGFFVSPTGATLAWPRENFTFDGVEADALRDVPRRLELGQVRLSPEWPEDLPWVATWLVTSEGESRRYLLQDQEDFSQYQRVMLAPDRITFARFDVAYPPEFDPLMYAFTAQRVQRGGSTGLYLTDGQAWTREPIVDWVLEQQSRERFFGLTPDDYAPSLAGMLRQLIDESRTNFA